jgi:magnesium transporter
LTSHLIAAAGEVASGRAEIERRLSEGRFFWLDLFRPTAEELALLRERFGFHPLALEDSEHFGQRPKLEPYDDHVFLVVYGAAPDEDRLVEVHCFYSELFLVTVHRDDCPAFAALRERQARRGQPGEPALVLHQVVDALVDSFFPILSEVDDEIDDIQNTLLQRPTDEQLQRVFDLKRQLVGLRKAVTPQRDLFATVGFSALPGMTPEAERYFRDVYDHLIRLGELIDSFRELLTGVTEVYLSTASNRMNAVIKQLTLVATIFLPLSFIAGFFGQNFGYMVDRVSGPAAFYGLGIGLQVAAAVLLLVVARRRGWFR